MRTRIRLAAVLSTFLAAQPAAAQWTTDRFTDAPPQAIAGKLIEAREDAFDGIEGAMALGGLGGALLARGVCAMKLRDTTACGHSMVGSALAGIVVGGFVWPALKDRLERSGRRTARPARPEDAS